MVKKVKVEVDVSKWGVNWRSVAQKYHIRKATTFNLIGQTLVSFVKSITPIKTGTLLRSWDYSASTRKNLISIWSDSPYVNYLDKGARPHMITPRIKQVLRFEVGGVIFFRHSVMHPGIPKFDFTGRAENESKSIVPQILTMSYGGVFL